MSAPAIGTRTVRVELGPRSYEVRIGPGLIDETGPMLADLARPTRAAVVTDSNVRPLYAQRLTRSLERSGVPSFILEVPAGERSKSVDELARLWDGMLDAGLDRKGAVVALGGGVVGDLAGFAAATVLRGVPVFQVPTTLLAQVDSSVGGKTAIDRPQGKNMVGAFWQPCGVAADVEALRTLPPRELCSGMAEVVKTAVIRSEELFLALEAEGAAESAREAEPGLLARAVGLACEVKSRVVGADERDSSGERAVLNFGHTVGHALEAAAGLQGLRHGEAVAVGMVAAGRLARRLGVWDEAGAHRLERLLGRLGLPVSAEGLGLGAGDVMRLLAADKKAVAGSVRFVLPLAIGRAELHGEPVPEDLVREVLAGLGVT